MTEVIDTGKFVDSLTSVDRVERGRRLGEEDIFVQETQMSYSDPPFLHLARLKLYISIYLFVYLSV